MIQIRSAVKEDCKNIIKLVQELADYQKLSDGPSLTPEKLEEDGFGSDPAFHCKVAYDGDKCVGYALYFYGFSTFYGRNAYMEDLYVSNNYRDKGIGSDLWRSAVKETLEKGCTTFDFSVLGDNLNAIEFYERKGAKNKTELENWHAFRLDKGGMEHFLHS
ncbi:thialysine N-epsilon-acetyltransferase [Lepeophtheirus salmonis]|uniref:Diamine acetyltransferase 2 n=1 Tax=Lepeophtheirus salmonis TaxID=72036 RepID=D3PK54_LEPSM|nr:thialysine N-epsilon-acetyltransferase-like [Lepeophtheirus salmonis]ADD38940.1 Diamine acetyltransferase 2 [Lepeophtheirus salmonis]